MERQFTVAELNARAQAVKFAQMVCKGMNNDPGTSDLDDEQPVYVRVTLGEQREAARYAAAVIRGDA